MCGSCSSAPARTRRWTATHLLVLLLVATLAALSIAGLTLRLRSGGETAVGCSHLAADQTAYQAEISHDLHSGTSTLVADTGAFIAHVRSERTEACTEFRSFVEGSRKTLQGACAPCAERLANSVGRT